MVDAGVSPIYRLYRYLWAGVDLLYPPTCGGCGRSGARWCLQCDQSAVDLAGPGCSLCGAPGDTTARCIRCSDRLPDIDTVRSWTEYDGPVRLAIQKLKYRRDLGLGEALSRPLASFIRGLGWEVDGLIPIPLSRQRRKRRGYNQVALVAWPLAAQLRIPYLPRAITKIRDTPSQVGLPLRQRQSNVRDAFNARPERVDGRAWILLDDVMTTGSTLSEGARALRLAGATRVYGVTLARAILARDGPVGRRQTGNRKAGRSEAPDDRAESAGTS